MRRTIVGTRFTTGCGHSWKRRYPWWTRNELSDATTDCNVCGELLIIPAEQFEGRDPDVFPAEVHMPLFHRWMHQQHPEWPANGSGTGYIEFDAD